MPLTQTAMLAELVSKKHDCLTHLRALGLRQIELIAAGEMADLLRLLSTKQRLISTLHDLERALDPFRDQPPADRSWSSPAARATCAQQAAECQKLLVEVLEQERDSESQLAAARDQAAEQLGHAQAAAAARVAYHDDQPAMTSQLDLSSH